MEAYGDKVRIVFRDFPLPNHPRARRAAEAAQCAHEQGKFWEYHDRIFAEQAAMTDDDFKRHATELGLNAESFDSCLASGRHLEGIDADHRYGMGAGVQGTPALFVNGRLLPGAANFEQLKIIIDEELARGS